LTLEEVVEASEEDRLQYYAGGRCLNIRVTKQGKIPLLTPFELYAQLRSTFDAAVEAHLKNHQEEFLASMKTKKTASHGIKLT
jgi:hypothetical protein